MLTTLWRLTKLLLFGLLCGAGSVALWVDAADTQPQFVLDPPNHAKPCTVRKS